MTQATADETARPVVTSGQHLLTLAFGLWLLAGVFIDGFAHNHGVVETFFTPWHGILYSGFAASAVWMGSLLFRVKRRSGLSWRRAVPEGYGLGAAGVAVFLLGGLADMTWHIVFGIEQSYAALLSPAHLMLFAGALLILSSPLRSAWNGEGTCVPGWREFAPPFLSTAFSASAAGFFLMYAWMFRFRLPSQPYEDSQILGVMMMLIDTLLLMYPAFMLMQRWTLPPGAMTLLFTIVTVLMNVLDGFEELPSIAVAAAAGATGDLLYRLLKPGGSRLWPYRLIAVAVPAVLWSLYFLSVALAGEIAWDVEYWTGGIVKTAFASLAVSLLALPPGKRRGQ